MSEGIRIEVPDVGAASEWSEPFKLPASGRMAQVRESDAEDEIAAERLALSISKPQADYGVLRTVAAAAFSARTLKLDGKQATYDDYRRLKSRDLRRIRAEMVRLGFLGEESDASVS